MEENESLNLTLTLDNGEEVECEVLTIYEVDGRQYIALLPLDDNEEEGDIYLYRFSEDADGEPVLGNIEEDDEYERAAAAFDEWLDEEESDDTDGDVQG